MPTRLRVVTLNVWNDEGDPRRAELINRELRRLDPDLVALQEVIRNPELDQLGQFLEGLDLDATHQADVAADASPSAEKYGGNALVTRWPHRVVEALDLRLPDGPDVPWVTLAAVVDVPGEGELLFITPTIAYQLEAEAVREQQVMAVAELEERHRRPLPTIIAGDFNASPDAASIRYLTGLQSLDGRSAHFHDAWAVAGEGPGYTWSRDNPNAGQDIGYLVGQPGHRRRIDYVLVGSPHAHPDAHCRIESAALAFDQPVDGVWASDHFGVVVDLEVGLRRDQIAGDRQ